MGDLLQFLVKTPVQPRGRFYLDGALADLDGTCTVTITKPDGTAGPASGIVTHVSTGIYSFTLAGPADPIVYDIAWSGQIGGNPVTVDTQAEALGELLFTLPELRDLRVGNGKPFATTAVPNFDAEQLQEARTATLEEFTRILGFSPVPRFAREVHDGDGRSTCLTLERLLAHKPLAVTVNGAAQAIGGYQISDGNQLEAVADYLAGTAFTFGRRNVAVEYVHGWQRVEGDAGIVAMARAAMRLIPGLADAASSVTTPDGTSISFDPAGQVTRAGTVRHFGVPAVDSWLNRWSQHPQSPSGPLVA
jgi:hypothetical protein